MRAARPLLRCSSIVLTRVTSRSLQLWSRRCLHRSAVALQPSRLTHVSPDNQPAMVDVSAKQPTRREAVARAVVLLPAEAAIEFERQQLQARSAEFVSKKGPVFATAIVAGTMAAKRTFEMIPFCHPMPIDGCDITITTRMPTVAASQPESNGNAVPPHALEVVIDCRVSVFHKTGVEMEALTGASVAALTVYDMLKAVSHNMEIRTRLLEKRGGKSDYRDVAGLA